MQIYKLSLLELMLVFNGCWWEETLTHHCSAACCRNQEETFDKMRRALCQVLLRGAPPVPSASKWTKLGPCCDSILIGMLLHDMLAKLFDVAFKKMDIELQKKAKVAHGNDGIDETLHADAQFHEVAGKRLRCSRDFLNSDESRFSIALLAVCNEPIRYLTEFWMKDRGFSARGFLHSQTSRSQGCNA